MIIPPIHPLAETSETVVLSRNDWEVLHDLLEDLQDAADVAVIKQRLAAGETEDVPWEVVQRLLDGENPVRVWREHRGISCADLAVASGLSPGCLNEIEAGEAQTRFDAMIRIARALDVELGNLVPPRSGA